MADRADAIDALLPQTQCGECDYAGCRPYAEAIASGQASIDRCPPGGVATLEALAKLCNVDPAPYREKVRDATRHPAIARINEDQCIGCTKCIAACPVDAIVGAAKHMHTIIEQECTGCGLCVEPCPVDCIELTETEALTFDKTKARQRFVARTERLEELAEAKKQRFQKAKKADAQQSEQSQARKAYIADALARVKAKKSSS